MSILVHNRVMPGPILRRGCWRYLYQWGKNEEENENHREGVTRTTRGGQKKSQAELEQVNQRKIRLIMGKYESLKLKANHARKATYEVFPHFTLKG